MCTKFTALTAREGDAFLLEDNGWKCLFDSGVDETIVNLLNYKGIDKLDLAICSHNDADHACGFIALLQSKIQIDEIWLPSLWLNILQYVQKNGIDWKKIDLDNVKINKRLIEKLDPKLIFTEDSRTISDEESNETLSYFSECRVCDNDRLKNNDNVRQMYEIVDDVIDKFFHHERKPSIKKNHNKIAKTVSECVIDSLNYELDSYCVYGIVTEVIDRMSRKMDLNQTKPRKALIRETLIELMTEYGMNHLIKSTSSEKEKNKIKELFGNIRNIAVSAHQRKCRIKWFEPKQNCSITTVQNSNFKALNSVECPTSKIQDNIEAFIKALHLTEVNKYSLVFEYWKDNFPIVRFSADSDCSNQSGYTVNIIVTAPHHGSHDNANVYNNIKGNDIIWVRSDRKSRKRPCDVFKNLNNKYCLACYTYGFRKEIIFEYDKGSKQWNCISGYSCKC